MGLITEGMQAGYFKSLVGYHRWRVEQVSELLKDVGEEYLEKKIDGSFSSLYIILNHLVWAEKVWFSRVQPEEIAVNREKNLDGLLREWNSISERWAALADKEGDFERKVVYLNTQNEKFENTLGEIIVHLIDHASYHTGQMMNTIRAFGMEPVSTNYIHFLRAMRSQEGNNGIRESIS